MIKSFFKFLVYKVLFKNPKYEYTASEYSSSFVDSNSTLFSDDKISRLQYRC